MRQAAGAALASAVVLAVGAYAGPGAGPDGVALIALAALLAPGTGWWMAARGPAGLPARVAWLLVPPATLALALALVQVSGARALPRPLLGALVIGGAYGLGAGLRALGGRRSVAADAAGAGWLVALALVLAGGPVLFGLADHEQVVARASPALAHALLVAAPDGLALEVAGADWSHTNPLVYATSGVEWLQRGPRGGGAAAVGAAFLGLGLVVAARRGPAAR